MTESIFHFAAGFTTGTAVLLPGLARRMVTGERMAAFFAKWFMLAFGLGVFAIAPGLLARAGMPERFLSSWWMNIFFFFPILNTVRRGGFIIGTACILVCVAVMYFALLLAIAKSRRENHQTARAG
jgi:hypothetical protein